MTVAIPHQFLKETAFVKDFRTTNKVGMVEDGISRDLSPITNSDYPAAKYA
jgi:hypothetical protein